MKMDDKAPFALLVINRFITANDLIHRATDVL